MLSSSVTHINLC